MASERPNRIVKTYRQVAEAFGGMDQDTVRKDWRPAGMPGKPGRWDLVEIARWQMSRQVGDKSRDIAIKLISDLTADDNQSDSVRDPELVAAAELRRRKNEAEAEIKEADARTRQQNLALQEGRLVDRESAVREVAALVVRIKQRLLAAPTEMEMDFPRQTRKQNKADFEMFVRGLLLEMSGWEMLDYDTTNELICVASDVIRGAAPERKLPRSTKKKRGRKLGQTDKTKRKRKGT